MPSSEFKEFLTEQQRLEFENQENKEYIEILEKTLMYISNNDKTYNFKELTHSFKCNFSTFDKKIVVDGFLKMIFAKKLVIENLKNTSNSIRR